MEPNLDLEREREICIFPWLHGTKMSCFLRRKVRAHVGDKGIWRVHGGVNVGETKIDWLFGTVDRHIVHID
jgi:hypothetical protein